MLNRDREVSMATTPSVDGTNEPSQARTACLAGHSPTSFASSRPVEREPEEVEGRPTFPALLPLRRTPEREKPRLVGMEGQSEVLQPFAEGVHHALRVFLVFEADDEVIGASERLLWGGQADTQPSRSAWRIQASAQGLLSVYLAHTRLRGASITRGNQSCATLSNQC